MDRINFLDLNEEELTMVAGGHGVHQKNIISISQTGLATGAYAESNGDTSTVKAGGHNFGGWEASAANGGSVTVSQSASASATNNN